MAAAPDWRRAAEAGLTFRYISDGDLPLLARIYASTRSDELAPVPWSEAQKAAFLEMQFRAQHLQYRQNYRDADWLIVRRGAEDIGRLYLERSHDWHRIIDIALLPDHRGHGLGEALLRDLLDEAGAAGRGVEIHVEKQNPAMRLYCRLGFTTWEDKGVYDLMRWTAQPSRA